MNTPIISCVLGALFGTAALADAATITVSKNGPIASIQAAFDQASAGDTILVKSGVYQETVKDPGGKDGVTLTAVGSVVLDARAPGGAGKGPALTLTSDDVTVRGFTIRNAAQVGIAEGDGIVAFGARARIEKCTIVGTEDDAIELRDIDAVVKNCTIRDAAFGVRLRIANGARISKCSIERTGTNAIVIETSSDVVLEKLTIDGNSDDAAIRTKDQTASDGCSVVACAFRNLGEGAITLNGLGSRVEKCKFLGGRCLVNLTGNSVVYRKNVMLESLDNERGLEIGGSNGALVAGNRFENVSDICIALLSDTTNATMTDTVLVGGEFEHEDAILIAGTGHTLKRCRVVRSGGDAFAVIGDSVTLVDCLALDCFGDGFEILGASDGATLDGCVALGSLHEGIDNSGTNTVLVDCVAKKNRIDVANDGTFAQFGVVFTTGGQNTPPELN